jgi:hypothetical protein
MAATVEAAIDRGKHVYLLGGDPGPESSGLVCLRVSRAAGQDYNVELVDAAYLPNRELAKETALYRFTIWLRDLDSGGSFFCYEKVGMQGKFCGESTFETATMGGEIRRAFRPFVEGTYAFRSSEWRHALTGVGNAKTPLVYAECCTFFQPTGKGSDPFKGKTSDPGPLWGLHAAGAGGNVEHLKDAMGVALGLLRVRFRSGRDPEIYRREW